MTNKFVFEYFGRGFIIFVFHLQKMKSPKVQFISGRGGGWGVVGSTKRVDPILFVLISIVAVNETGEQKI